MGIRNINTQFFRGVMVTTEKNIRIYYTKAPVMIFGLLFPLFMFLSFYLGREINLYFFFPGLLAMSLFFTASSIGPLITPWEKQAGTFERLLSFPVSINTIILGDIAAGMIFGIFINVIVLIVGLVFFNYSINILFLLFGILFASFCFSSLGVLLASPSVRSPSHIMMFSSLIRFPLIFISGIFIPLESLQGGARVLAYFSPITYLVDIFNFSFKGESHISLIIDFTMLFVFSIIFIFLSNRFHKRNLMKGL
ncbi:MAG: ABC transporter permease [Candidatus Cloacimonadota bacterium]|nr:MAG: ABC transporter permease [Candidatus Cloacimonadota bacterium]